MIFLTNTLSGKKEQFASIKEKKILLYVCGITPYDYAHIGHGRCYVFFDLFYRFTTFLGYQVVYCRNFTDLDDKLLNRAQKELGSAALYSQVADRFIAAYHEDMKKLNCLSPQFQPRVTQYIPEIITFVQDLIQRGYAYEHQGSVYFRVRLRKDYGKLSKRDINDLISGARVEIDGAKEDPLDFALWKADNPEVSFKSPWGFGRPGWHIECSAFAKECLGSHIDVHGGGMDLIFPHHENEIAQSESLFKAPFAKYWLHNAFVQVNKEKMSKSLGNFFTLQEIFKSVDPMVLRFYLLRHWYRGPIDFSLEDIQADQKAYKRIVAVFADVDPVAGKEIEAVSTNMIVEKMIEFLQDDFNTSGMFGVLFEHLPAIKDDVHTKKVVKYFLMHVMGLNLQPLPEEEIVYTPEIQALLQERQKARDQKDWKKADLLRDQLKELGIEIKDVKKA